MDKAKCNHERFRWSLILNEGICIECMARLTEMPISTTLSSPESEAKTAEEIWEKTIYTQHLESGDEAYVIEKADFVNALKEYAELYSKKLEERVRALEGIVENAHDYASRAVWINEKQDNGQEFYEYISKVSFLAGEKEAHNKAINQAIDAFKPVFDLDPKAANLIPIMEEFRKAFSELEKLKR